MTSQKNVCVGGYPVWGTSAKMRVKCAGTLKLYTTQYVYRLNPEFAAIETLLAICLSNHHVVHPLKTVHCHNRHNTGKEALNERAINLRFSFA